MYDYTNLIFCESPACLLMHNACDVEYIIKVIESLTVLNRFAVVFVVRVEDLQVSWKSKRTRFGMLTGLHSGDGSHEMMEHDKYIPEKYNLETPMCLVSRLVL